MWQSLLNALFSVTPAAAICSLQPCHLYAAVTSTLKILTRASRFTRILCDDQLILEHIYCLLHEHRHFRATALAFSVPERAVLHTLLFIPASNLLVQTLLCRQRVPFCPKAILPPIAESYPIRQTMILRNQVAAVADALPTIPLATCVLDAPVADETDLGGVSTAFLTDAFVSSFFRTAL